MKKIFIVLFLSNVLVACSSNHKPAEVIELQGVKPSTHFEKGSIKSNFYIVKKGETLFSISWRSNTDIRTIASINNLEHPYKIFPGQKIFLTSNIKKSTAGKTSSKNQNKYSKNTLKKGVDSKKNQAYGENVSKKKGNKNTTVAKQSFSKKLRGWQWPSDGKVISYFSTRHQGNKGIDIIGNKGDLIKSAADGSVVYAGNALRGYGNLVIIKHNDDYLSAYAHNDELLVKENQQIKIGQVIAKMGSTDAKRVMLHFEVRFRGKSVNPLKYLPKN